MPAITPRPAGETPPGAGAPTAPADHPVRAITLLLLAMLVFVGTDGAAKFLAASLPATQIIWMRYVVISVLLVPLLVWRRGERLLATRRPVLHFARGVLLMVSGLLFVLALGPLPLALCTAIGFVAPLYVTALSIPLLGEKVGVRRWCAVAVGFLGVLVILRPGGAGFHPAMLLPLASSLCWALGLIITRIMRSSERPMTILAWSSLVGAIACAPLALPTWRPPDAVEWLVLIAIGVFNAIAQYLVIRAFLLASASVLAPFSYSTIVWATLIGVVFFDTVPDAATVAGAATLIAAGLYVWHRERVHHVPPTVQAASLSEAAEPDGAKRAPRPDP